MNKEETVRILRNVQAVWPAFIKDRDPAVTAAVWQRIFENDPYQLVDQALMAYASTDTKGFPPAPGALKAIIADLREEASGGAMTPMEAWILVTKAISNGIYGAEAEFARLPPAVQQAVGHPDMIREWAQMDVASIQSVVASNFRRSFEARARYEREKSMLPPGCLAALAFPEASALPEGDAGLPEGDAEALVET